MKEKEATGMLKVQEFLRNGGTLEQLAREPYNLFVRKHETAVVVIVLIVRFESSLEIRPCFRVGGGSGFVLPCFHRDFASIIRTHPSVEFL